MSKLSMVEATLPPGFRFHPRDDELICDYLSNNHRSPLLVQVDLNNCEPWDLPETACVGGKEWYFYSQRGRKYATGLRTNRATLSGYWKATGKDRCVLGKGLLVGMRKTLVFYLGRAPKGNKTDWVMHEFRVHGPLDPSLKEDWVLCKVFCKNRESSNFNANANVGSNTLPTLTEPYNNLSAQSEQVPCFSIFTSPLSNPQFDLLSTNAPSSSSSSLSYHGEEKEAIKAVLSRFKDSTLSFATQDQMSFLSDATLPATMWYP